MDSAKVRCRGFIACSLDGFIATADGGIDWLQEHANSKYTDYGYHAFTCDIDLIIMGRKTFETVAEFDPWPYEHPVWVLSSTSQPLEEKWIGKAQKISPQPLTILSELLESGVESVYVDGGKTICWFMQHKLLSELTVTVIPVILGKGIRLFSGIEQPIGLKKVSTTTFDDSVVQLVYKPEYSLDDEKEQSEDDSAQQQIDTSQQPLAQQQAEKPTEPAEKLPAGSCDQPQETDMKSS